MKKFIMSEFLAIVLYVLFIYFFLYHDFRPGGGSNPWGLIFLPCSIAVSARAIFSLDKIKRRTKNVFMCLNIFVGIIIFLINCYISIESRPWGNLGMIG